MVFHLKTLAAAALAVTLSGPAFAQEEMTVDTVVATVNGQEITLGQMLLVRASLPEQYQQLENDVLWDGILQQMIQQEALRQQDDAVETKRVQLALENERRSLLASVVVAKVAKEAINEEAVQAAYDAQFADFDAGQEYNASHILVETEEEAQAIIDELKGGADFVETARAKSTGPSGPNGGQLGWFSAGMMVQEFQTAVEALEVDGISEPVKTQFGWHVIKLNDARSKSAPPLEAVRGEIEATLQRDTVTAYITDLEANADVTKMSKDDVDTSILNNLELVED
ncbi:peptidylprolyl isomerase [Thalassococcus lentus]|uniref:Parvulin-like PPIase n=1 Tax=Thalassococcus lentus TaxID=1210524 RepID=A0ABT4XPH4_9RHOB|nr:peptidylprolyl isomerase [Thalassococcus lentus]MDA7423851.1 peptidylprolyl isomerase [Thalassococcus lentus]